MAYQCTRLDRILRIGAVGASQRYQRTPWADRVRGRIQERLRTPRMADRSSRIKGTRRFVDLTVQPDTGPERRLSLKSTAARKLSKTALHISKLTEAAWVQDARTARDRRSWTQDLFRQYQSAVTHIVMLRAFRERQEVPSLYQLVEIPASIFNSIQSAPLDVFTRDAPLIECQIGGNTVAVVAIDRSDAKITVRRVQLSACTVHAEWSRS